MQFVKDGPNIPDRLVQAHEEGRVVFFCGAGVSYPAGLPGFAGLVERIFDAVGEPPNALERRAIRARQFDTAIGQLEGRLAGGREAVRRAVADILRSTWDAPQATASHRALLTLAHGRNGRTRLVTTNFDRAFETVIERDGLQTTRYRAPLLPVPKTLWDGIVYLHGLLPAAPTTLELDCLVLSSGDFGLAYLTERWAARFVGELFRNYTVCFVGYSINDPVLRYMMDALAADRLRGESPPEMFAFGSHSKGKAADAGDEWRAKNVIPILYREHRRHAHLHHSLQTWAATYRDGVSGKEQIAVQYAGVQPQQSTQEDDFVRRMLWALSDPSGLPARRFADHLPTPSLDWLDALSDQVFGHADLSRFGVPPLAKRDDKLHFSLIARPAPYSLAPWMSLVDADSGATRFDDAIWHLARWLTLHLDDPKLVIWLTKRGGQIHPQFARLLERRLDELATLERKGEVDAIERTRRTAPRAIPRPAMRTLWRLLLTHRVRVEGQSLALYQWASRLKRDGLTAALRMELRQLLTPCVSLREPLRWRGEADEPSSPERLKSLADWEIVLSTDAVHSWLRHDSQIPEWHAALPDLLDDFAASLHDALDLMREMDGASDLGDLSYIYQPSISAHSQNRGFHDWTALIELTRDAWLATAATKPDRALLAANRWQLVTYPLFRRLAFFAAAQGDIVPPDRALAWLLADEGWWFWSIETQREAFRLMVALARRSQEAPLDRLEQVILQGPPRKMFRDDLAADRWTRIVDRDVWVRLATLKQEAPLGNDAQARFDDLSARYPDWRLAPEERDEFPSWISVGEDRSAPLPTPARRRELVAWLKAHPDPSYPGGDDWDQRCRVSFPATACALCVSARDGFWPVARWQGALQAWAEDSLRRRSWRHMAPVIATAPNEVLLGLAHGLAWWLKAVAKAVDPHEESFFVLSERLLELEHPDGMEEEEAVNRAINHPIGKVTEALLGWWLSHDLQDGQGLPKRLRPVFTRLCDTSVVRFRHARVLLAAHAVTLFRVDRDWAVANLVPAFDWQRSPEEAAGAWEGFLWSPRLYRPLLAALRPAILETARHYADLHQYGRQYADFITYAALDRGDTFNAAELRVVFRALPPGGLSDAAHALARALEGAGAQRESYWDNRIVPFWGEIWPKSRQLASPAIAEALALLCIAAGLRLPAALDTVRPWLQSVPYDGHVVHRLLDSGACTQFPTEALALLEALVSGDQPWAPYELGGCLDAIRTADPDLANDPRFVRLTEHWRRRAN